MASKKGKSAVDRGKKETKRAGTKKDAKPSIFARLKKWFVNIIMELKRVVWPDKKKLKQSTLTVLLIIALSTVLILIFDSLIGFILRTTGFYSTKPQTPETTASPAITDTSNPGESGEPTGTSPETSSTTQNTGA